MADTIAATSTPPPRKKHGFLRFLVFAFSILIVLLVVGYFVATSSAFFKSVILPKAGKAMNATITADDASISPFSEVTIKNLKVSTTGSEPLLSAAEVKAHYHLMDIIRGHIYVDEVTLTSPVINRIENPDGTSNLDPILKSQKEKPPEKSTTTESKSSKPLDLDLKKLAMTDATIRNTKLYAKGNRDVAELTHVNISADNLKNGQTGKLSIAADISVDNHPPEGTNGSFAAKLSGAYDVALSADLKPASIQGKIHLEVSQATGAFSDMAGFGSDFDCNVTPTEVKQVALRFAKGGTQLGEVTISGPLDMEKMEGHLSLVVQSIDKRLLNIVGAKNGLDFGSTTLNFTNDIQLAKGGTSILVGGRLAVDKLQVTRSGQKTPTLDLLAQFNLAVDTAAKNATIRELKLEGNEKGKSLLHGELTSPMSLSWGSTDTAVGDSTLNVSLNDLNLMDWKPFIGDSISSGNVKTKLQLVSQQAGKLLSFNLDSLVQNLTAQAGANQISQAGITTTAKGRVTNLKKVDLSDFSVKIDRQNQTVLTVGGAGTYDIATTNADLQMTLNSSLPRLLDVVPQTNAAFSSGTVELKARVVQQQDTIAVTGNLSLTDLTGNFGKNAFHSFQTKMELDLGKKSDAIEIRRANGTLSENGKTGGSYSITGKFDSSTKVAQISAKLTDFNQDGLRPFLEPLLADKKLVSVTINGTADANYNPSGDASAKADFKVANLVVSDPQNSLPSAPLEASFQVDAGVQKQKADIRQCALILTPTTRAKNELRVTGQVDMSDTNAYQGNLKVSAESLDLTKYYDLFAGNGQSTVTKSSTKSTTQSSSKTTSTTTTTTVSSSTGDVEREPIKLPLRNFTAEVDIARLYLREVDLSGFQTTTKVDGGHVVLNPFKLTLNGAPVSANADLDLGVPGYKYDTSLDLKAVPLTPLVNSFSPENKGKLGGTLSAQAKIKGSGTTGVSLKKNLTGNFDFSSTNLNLSVADVKQPILKLIINIVGAIPELSKDPGGAAKSLLGQSFGSTQGGLTDELKKSPIDAVSARGVAGSGKIGLQQSMMKSTAFEADATGTITLADILTNSAIQLPVTISLSQSVAKRFGLGSSDTNAAYAKMPDFLVVVGTIGKPDADRKKLFALGGTALGGIIKAIPGTGNTGNLIQNLVGGNKSATSTNSATGTTTNQPSRTESLLKDFSSALGKNSSTNSAPAATNQPATNKSPARTLLNDLLKPK